MKKQTFENIHTSINTEPEDIVRAAGIKYRSIESFYHPDRGWTMALDTGLVNCDEKSKTITFHPLPPVFQQE